MKDVFTGALLSSVLTAIVVPLIAVVAFDYTLVEGIWLGLGILVVGAVFGYVLQQTLGADAT